ncbi:MAG: WecB/TagA/CpsF family glycosyltransferase [Cyclobacteriaceae bacterium]|nr:WecB/TagA/CpsF family glycosyltransferase [Cyclobacteriaceae bacterium]
MEETVIAVDMAIQSGKQIHHACVNAGKIVSMQKDPILRESVNSCNLINADGQAIVWASRILRAETIPERVSGVDLMEKVIELAAKKDYKVFFFGAEQEIVEKTINYYSTKYSDKIIAGFRNGYFSEEEEINIAKEIAQSGAHILFVAIKTPIKENFLYKHRSYLKNVSFIMGVGGSFDVVSGKVKRAPLIWQSWGMEWLYRLLQEPRKMWKRYLIGNFVFVRLVFMDWIKRK